MSKDRGGWAHAPSSIPAGTFIMHFGKQVHYDGAKDEETVLLLITGEGPATSTLAEK